MIRSITKRTGSALLVVFWLAACSSPSDGNDSSTDAAVADGATDAVTSTDGSLSDASWDATQGTDGAQTDAASRDCIDPDHDGYGDGTDCLGPDCAPDDGSIHPGAQEICDGQDNNCNGQTDEADECALPRIWVFLLAGQSNMVGLGIDSELGATDRAPVPNTVIYYDGSVHNQTNPNTLQWLGLGPGFGVDGAHFGPELNFGRRFQQYWPGRPVAIIKVAEGGTGLFDRWRARSGDLYQLLMQDIQSQLAALSQNYQVQVVGFVWMQGETDAAYDDHSQEYYQNFTTFMRDLREDLGIEHLGAVAGLIAEQQLWPYASRVRNATVQVAIEQGSMTVVETNDLPRHPSDPAHYNTQGQLGLGYRFGDVMGDMLRTEYNFQDNFIALQGYRFWFYRSWDNGSTEPMTYDNDNQRWSGSEPFELIGPGWMHPGATKDAELAWWAPFTARIQVDVTASAADNGGGDGTWVTVSRNENPLWGPQHVPNNDSETFNTELVVQQGEELEFRTSSGPNHDVNNDTTAWQIRIQVLDVDP